MLSAVACVVLVACTKDIDTSTHSCQLTISATVQVPGSSDAPITKVSPDASTLSTSSLSFHWEAGDKVVLCSNDSKQQKLFTIVDASINGTSANFIGEALSDMSSFNAYYLGNNTSIERFNSLMSGGEDNLSYEINNFHPYIMGAGASTGITFNNF